MPIAQSSSKSQAGNTKSTKQHKTSEVIETEQKPQEQTSGTKTPPEQPEFIKQTLVIIEKKVRNLDKRRQKLEEYKESARKGATLNEDQLSAVSRYDEVIRTLELSRELEKQFISLANDTMKQQKKQLKKEQMEREEQMKERLKECHRYFSLLERFGDEVVRNEFLAETNGATKVTQSELELLDEFDKLVAPCSPGAGLEVASSEFAEHLYALVEGKNRPIPKMTTTVTYSELKKLMDRLLSASYWTQEPEKKEEVPVTEVKNTEEVTPSVETNTLNQAVESLQLNEPTIQQNEQASYQGHNVDDFVMVSSSDCAESLCQSKSPSLQPQQQSQQILEQVPQEMTQSQAKTFFSTLNQPEQRQNINEFINSCENNGEGLNFFQDSELSRQQQQEQQNEMNFQAQHQQEVNFNQQPTDMQKDQQFRQRGNNGNRPYQQRRHPDDRRNGNQQPRDNRGPRNNNGYRGGANSGPRGDANGQRGGYRGQNGRPNNGPRGNYHQQQRGNFNQDMHEQHSQMA